MSKFSQKVRERVSELELTHAEVARRCGLSERRFGHYVTGTREPDLATLLQICGALETTPNVMLGVDQSPGRTGTGSNLHAAIIAGVSSLSPPNLRLAKALVDTMIVQQRTTKRAIKPGG